jgi:hypothetical protein
MIATVEGVYKKGKIELLEVPVGVDESRVLVTFFTKSNIQPVAASHGLWPICWQTNVYGR